MQAVCAKSLLCSKEFLRRVCANSLCEQFVQVAHAKSEQFMQRVHIA